MICEVIYIDYPVYNFWGLADFNMDQIIKKNPVIFSTVRSVTLSGLAELQ